MRQRVSGSAAAAAGLLGALAIAAPNVAFGMGRSMACEDLVSLRFSNATITVAEVNASGEFDPPPAGGQVFTDLPPFCRVVGTVEPKITFEVWLPIDGWNHKFQAVGGGGLAGVISYSAMAGALQGGYATSSTDTGHSNQEPNAAWILDEPERLVDYAYRGIHEMTLKAKRVVRKFYGTKPDYSYFVGCSTGGRQGLMEIQRYPTSYDGVVSGAPVNNFIGLHAAQLWTGHRALLDDAGQSLPATRFPAAVRQTITDAVLARCDGIDGVLDGVIENPEVCDFDPGTLALAADQIDALRRIYQGPVRPDGRPIHPGAAMGGEVFWAPIVNGPGPFFIADVVFGLMTFGDPTWDWRTFDFDADWDLAMMKIDPDLTAMDPMLRDYRGMGGKIIQYHGWNDQLLFPGNSVNYYKSVVETMRGRRRNPGADAQALMQTQDFFRLFMVPGMTHCRGGTGTDSFDMLQALEMWVEHGIAPDRIVASRVEGGSVVRTRPLCPWPQVAQWTGAGSSDDADNFVCVTPE